MKFTPKQIKEIKAHYKKSKSLSETAREMSKKFGIDISKHNIAYWNGRVKGEVPLSEDLRKIATATKEELIEELRRMAKANPEMIIVRNYFRNESIYRESAWNEHFGTFEEFKRQAGLKLTRHARRMELDVARHASVDTFKEMNAEKRNWGEAYLRGNKKRFQLVLVGSDVHDIECDPFWRTCFLDTAKRAQPDIVVLNGDIFDLPEFGKYEVDPREWDVVGRIKWVHRFLAELRAAVPEAEIHFIEGNHEFRLLRHLSEATPAMKAVLADLHDMTVPKLLGLTQFEINYVAPADLAVFTKTDLAAQVKRNFLVIKETVIAHHFPEGNSFGLPGWNGHHHSHEVRTYYGVMTGSYEWHQLGSGHKREASYTNGEKWGNGFLLAHLDVVKKRAAMEYIDTTSDHAVIGGKWYHRVERQSKK